MAKAHILTASGGALTLTNAFLMVNTVIGKLADGREYQYKVLDGDAVQFTE